MVLLFFQLKLFNTIHISQGIRFHNFYNEPKSYFHSHLREIQEFWKRNSTVQKLLLKTSHYEIYKLSKTEKYWGCKLTDWIFRILEIRINIW